MEEEVGEQRAEEQAELTELQQSRQLYERLVREEIFRGTRPDCLPNALPPKIQLVIGLDGVDTSVVLASTAERRQAEFTRPDWQFNHPNDPTQRLLVLNTEKLRRLHPDYQPDHPGKNDAEVGRWLGYALEDTIDRRLSAVVEVDPALLKPEALQALVARAYQGQPPQSIECTLVLGTPLERKVLACKRYAEQWGAYATGGMVGTTPAAPDLQNDLLMNLAMIEQTRQLLKVALEGGVDQLNMVSPEMFNLDSFTMPQLNATVNDTIFFQGLMISMVAGPPSEPLLEHLSGELGALLQPKPKQTPMPEAVTTEMSALRAGMQAFQAGLDQGQNRLMGSDEALPTFSPPSNQSLEPLFLDPHLAGVLLVIDPYAEAGSARNQLIFAAERTGKSVVSINITNPDQAGNISSPDQAGNVSNPDQAGNAAAQIAAAQEAGQFVVVSIALAPLGPVAPNLMQQFMAMFPAENRLALCFAVSAPLQREQASFAEYQTQLYNFGNPLRAGMSSLRDAAEALPPGENRTALFGVVVDLIEAAEQPEVVGTHLTTAQTVLQRVASQPELMVGGAAQAIKEAQRQLLVTQAAAPHFDPTPRPESLPVQQEIVALAQQRGVAPIAIATPGGEWLSIFTLARDNEGAGKLGELGEGGQAMKALEQAYRRKPSPADLTGQHALFSLLEHDLKGSGFPQGLLEKVVNQQEAVARQIGLDPANRAHFEKDWADQKGPIEASLRMAETMVKRMNPSFRLSQLPADVDLKELNNVQVMGVTTHHAVLRRGGGGGFQAVLLEKLEEQRITINEHQRLEVPGVEKDAGKNRGPMRN